MELNPGRVVFKEPEGTTTSLVFFAFSLVFLAIYAYYGLLLDSGPINTLVMGVAFALMGLAEALPADRRHVAGGLRVLSIGSLVVLLIVTLVAPDLLGI